MALNTSVMYLVVLYVEAQVENTVMANQSEKYSTATVATATKLFSMGNVATRFYNDVMVATSRAFPMGYSSLDLFSGAGHRQSGASAVIVRKTLN